VRSSEFCQFVTHRTGSKFVSFSWANRGMGLIMPIGEGHEGSPFFTVPMLNSLVGEFDLQPKGNMTTKVLEHTWARTPEGFETTGTLLRAGGRLKQTIRLTSLGEKMLVFQDVVTAVTNVSVVDERGVSIGIENDEVSGGTRLLSHQDGQVTFEWRKPRALLKVPGGWANVGGRLGVVRVAGSGLAYVQATNYGPMSVCTDGFYGSFSDQRRDFQPGAEVARRTALIMVEVTSEQTASLARSVRIEGEPNRRSLRFKLPEGGAGQVPLM
jgi:hypothetical protein